MKILIVEDDALHRTYLGESVRAALPECDMVLEAADGATGERLAREHASDRVVMDLQMSPRNGIEAARTIWRSRQPMSSPVESQRCSNRVRDDTDTPPGRTRAQFTCWKARCSCDSRPSESGVRTFA